jgi:hypothetical protein
VKQQRKSFSVAYCGITCALTLVVMFAAVIPALVYLSAAFAGVIVWSAYSQTSLRWGLLTYAAAAILSIVLVPEIEGKTYFIFFFGYYPLVRERFLRIKFRLLRFAAKLAVFNAAAVSAFLLVVRVFGVADVLEGMEWAGVNAVYAFWALGNLVFLIYDFVLPQMFYAFEHWVKPALNRKIK